MLQIDGSHGEGGGQMMRSAVALSLLTALPFQMTRIRAGREKPGLKAQHLHVLHAVVRLTGSSVDGASLGSTRVAFTPAPLRAGSCFVDVGTAGSLTLLLQTLLPVSMFSPGPVRLDLTGGTDVAMSPPWDFLSQVTLPVALPLAESIDAICDRRGYFPSGGGHVSVATRPKFMGPWQVLLADIRKSLPPIDLVHAEGVAAVRVRSVASPSLRDRRVAERQADSAAEKLGSLGVRVQVDTEYAPSRSPGSVVTTWAHLRPAGVVSGTGLGERRVRAEEVGAAAANRMLAAIHSGASVDEHLADQILLWLALRGGRIRASVITDHTRTNAWLIERFLGPTFRLDESSGTVEVL